MHGGVLGQGQPPHLPYHLAQAHQVGEDVLEGVCINQFARFENPSGHKKPDPKNYTDGLTVIPHPYYVNIKLIRKI